MTTSVIEASALCRVFASEDGREPVRAVDGVTFAVPPEARLVALIGPDGAGKSTLMQMICGLVGQNSGSLSVLGRTPDPDDEDFVNAVGYMPQTLGLYKDLSVMENMKLFGALRGAKPPEDMTIEAYYASLIALTGLEGFEGRPAGKLSGGMKQKLALAVALVRAPALLLLDEPTNHLDAESIDWLEQHLQQYEGTVIAVTHDRYFLDHVAGWILELDRGEGIPWKGNYSSWLEQKTKRMEQEEKTASKRRKTLERELEWVRMAPKARQAKGKARLNSYDKLLNEDVKEKEEKLEIFIPNGPRLGNKVIEAKHVAKAFGDKLLFDDLNFMLPPNGIVGIIGPNGAGKTTLFRLIMGLEKADKGEFEVGETVKVAYVDQQHKDIDPNKSVYQVISGGNDLIRMGGRDINARAYLSRFNFSGADQEKLCGVLSGGERNRLHLALCLKEEGNVLLLDEPTNDIDVNTLRALEEGLEDFAGCAVVISHDRWFLDRICTHILAFEGDSNVFFFEGSYSEYEENKQKRLGKEEPTRVRYRKLMND